jgi:hypothetical protein
MFPCRFVEGVLVVGEDERKEGEDIETEWDDTGEAELLLLPTLAFFNTDPLGASEEEEEGVEAEPSHTPAADVDACNCWGVNVSFVPLRLKDGVAEWLLPLLAAAAAATAAAIAPSIVPRISRKRMSRTTKGKDDFAMMNASAYHTSRGLADDDECLLLQVLRFWRPFNRITTASVAWDDLGRLA